MVRADTVLTRWQFSALDAERFGVSTARASAVKAEEAPGLVASCRDAGIELLIARCSAADLGAVQALERAGLRLMDAQVMYSRRLEVAAPRPRTAVRPFVPADLDPIVHMARATFAGYSGHYHADPRLPRHLCDEVYASWAERCCVGDAADTVVVIELGGRVAAFSAFGMVADREARLQLGAVADWARGRQLYTEMALAGMSWARHAGAQEMSAITQLTNLPAQHSWLRAEMTPRDSWFTFHGWLD
jgi:hypothetical protein